MWILGRERSADGGYPDLRTTVRTRAPLMSAQSVTWTGHGVVKSEENGGGGGLWWKWTETRSLRSKRRCEAQLERFRNPTVLIRESNRIILSVFKLHHEGVIETPLSRYRDSPSMDGCLALAMAMATYGYL